MRIASVLHVIGFLLMFLAAAMLLPLPFSFYYHDATATDLLISAAITLLCGFALWRASKLHQDLRPKEGFAIVTFGWLAFALFGSLPFMLSGAIPSVTNAFFETMSGFTTTGATILEDIERVPQGILFWRSLTHWIGGMGIIVLSLAILPFLGVGGMQLYRAELRSAADRLTPRITETAKILWGVYVAITAAEALLLLAGGMNLFEALCHAFGTMATGGYSTRNASIGGFHSGYIDVVVIFFMIVAGSNFSLHYRFLKGDFKVYFRNQEFLFFISLIGLATAAVCADTLLHHYDDFGHGLRDSTFQVVSILTTTGYGTADYEQWSFSSQFVLLMLMFFGGCAGSTGGGMKMYRIHVVVKFVFREITRLLHPHAVVPVRLGKEAVDREIVANVIGFFILFVLIFVVGVYVMSAMGLDMPTSFGAVAASLSNIGPGLGAVGPTDTYAHLPAAGKWFLAALMLTGRLEIFTVIILFSPSYWRK
ncbi:MAG: TrkH family potassium uptake protein [Candidatus Krumholzibacteria bacterium]|nr:TrkH family potassium uptake protein [Candidatus Krumholzibacteria bacterium]